MTKPLLQFYLSGVNPQFQSADSLGHPKTRNGLECFYYWGDAAPKGSYKHPVDGYEFDITSDLQNELQSAHSLMLSRGVDCPIVEDHKEEADKTLGYVVGSKIVDGHLWMLNQYLGKDARDTGLKNRQSPYIEKDFKDGHGNKYPVAVRHLAATPVPVLPNQKDFIAASRGPVSESLILTLSAEKDQFMNEDEILSFAKEMCPDDKDLDKTNCLSKMKAAFAKSKLSKADENDKDNAELSKKLSAALDEIKTLKLSRPTTVVTDPEIMTDRADLKSEKIMSFVTSGKLSMSAAKSFIEKFVKPGGKPSVMMLSRSEEFNARPVDLMIDYIEKDFQPGVKEGSTTQPQVLQLSAATGGDPNTPSGYNPATDPQLAMMKATVARNK